MIVSPQNQVIKNMRRLRRCKGDHALLEGPHLLHEALDAGLSLDPVLAEPDFLTRPEGREILERLDSPPLQVAPRLLDRLCDADSPRGILAVTSLPRTGAESLPREPAGIYLLADGLQDPGNLGALARVCEALAASALVLTPGSVHPNHPRALRASAGSLLRLPTAVATTAPQLGRHLEGLEPLWIALVPRGGSSRTPPRTPPRPWVLLLGAEGPGLSPELVDQADHRITLDLEPPVESLNAAVAAALVLWEVRRATDRAERSVSPPSPPSPPR